MVSLLFAPSLQADLIIQVEYSGVAAYESAFQNAANTWQTLLVGYQDGFVTGKSFDSSAVVNQSLPGVTIEASIESIDGPGNALGQAGFTSFAFDQSGFKLATDGIMEFDADDIMGLSSSQLNALVLHEMAHVLGFGTLWTDNGVYVNASGEFTGANATAAWQSEFGELGTPDVELGGGLGTANAHWNETDGGAATGIQDDQGRDISLELMTGWLNNGSYISDMTVASFVDIGFAGATAVPEPSTFCTFGLVAVALLARQRRSNKTS